jgi:hypothetical protein
MKIMLDSGAFSAFTRNSSVDRDEYMAYIKKNEKFIECYINLDVIGDAEAGWANQEYFESHGLNPMPVFHPGDDLKYLERCLEYDYFCLGGIAGKNSSSRRLPFLDKCFRIICDNNGIPKSKVHGLGVTSPAMLRRYPFYSVDSTSWLMTGATGVIIVPRKRNGEFVYDLDPIKIAVSSKSKSKGYNQHYDTAIISKKRLVDEYLEFKGYSLGDPNLPKEEEGSGLYTDHYLRMKLNAEYFKDFMQSLPDYPWAFKTKRQGNLF